MPICKKILNSKNFKIRYKNVVKVDASREVLKTAEDAMFKACARAHKI